LEEQAEAFGLKQFDGKRISPAPDSLAEPRRFLYPKENCYAETAYGSAAMHKESMLSQARAEAIAELEERINIQSKKVDRLLNRMMDLKPGVNIRNRTAELQRVPHDDDDLNDCNMRFLDARRLIAWTASEIGMLEDDWEVRDEPIGTRSIVPASAKYVVASNPWANEDMAECLKETTKPEESVSGEGRPSSKTSGDSAVGLTDVEGNSVWESVHWLCKLLAEDEDSHQQTFEDGDIADEEGSEIDVFDTQSYSSFHLRSSDEFAATPVEALDVILPQEAHAEDRSEETKIQRKNSFASISSRSRKLRIGIASPSPMSSRDSSPPPLEQNCTKERTDDPRGLLKRALKNTRTWPKKNTKTSKPGNVVRSMNL